MGAEGEVGEISSVTRTWCPTVVFGHEENVGGLHEETGVPGLQPQADRGVCPPAAHSPLLTCSLVVWATPLRPLQAGSSLGVHPQPGRTSRSPSLIVVNHSLY